jgi:4-hydroxy-4-methyl-2-oxoglutarate aldolase
MRADMTDLTARLAQLQSCVVADVLDEMGFRDQVLATEIRALSPTMKVAGPAFCIRGQASPGSTVTADRQEVQPGYEMFRRMYSGCVAVMDTGGHRVGGPWGENTALSARVRGCAGAIIDGGTRDSVELEAMGFPVFARFVTPSRVEGRWTHTAFEVPITLPGQSRREVVVVPGDLMLADGDGVVVVPRAIAGRVVADGEEVTRIEERMRRELLAGVDREEVYRRHDRYAHIAAAGPPAT